MSYKSNQYAYLGCEKTSEFDLTLYVIRTQNWQDWKRSLLPNLIWIYLFFRQGDQLGEPFIDDYICTHEQV